MSEASCGQYEWRDKILDFPKENRRQNAGDKIMLARFIDSSLHK